MPDLEPQQSDSSHADVDLTDIDGTESELPERPSQREGLPPHYRMRAERHYVDHLSAPAAGVPVRMIPVTQLAPRPSVSAKDLEPLVRSVRAHGVIQPLLVRRERSTYHVIAGKNRLAAAVAAGLAEVPCIVHQVDEAGAAALEAAERVRADRGTGPLRASVGAKIADSVREIAEDLARLRTTLGLLRDSPKGFQQAVAVDLVAAQSWRTLWLANVASLLSGGKCPEGRERSLAATVENIVDRFEPECRLSRLRIAVTHHGGATLRAADGPVGVALTGAIIVTLSLIDSSLDPTVEIHSQAVGERGFALEVVQRQATVSKETADRFSNQALSDPAPGTVGLGAIALSHLTALYNGASELTVNEESGSTLRLTFPHT